ncbi:cytochrome P450 [Cantharellus anzutake]|uniref:cytochrome P450 n=1 Tax=Cantharellus anzutake TaxID=1750568 RepID=UPI001907B3F4|nr:cytochrome P450 [Cantharellus anzutake]KAF8337876.1 cytochrome P450 [Cantharellus anzutake]
MYHLLFLGLGFAIFWLFQQTNKRKLPYPPGPKGYPIIGNAAELEVSHSWLYYQKLKEKYGDIVYLSAMGQPILILNSRKAIQDLVINKAAIFANRPKLTMCGELVGWEKTFGLANQGSRFTWMRKSANHHLGKSAVQGFLPVIEKSVHKLLGPCWAVPHSFDSIFKFTVSKIMLESLYGIAPTSPEDPFVKMMGSAASTFGEASQPGAFLIDAFPTLKYVPSWFPFAGFKRQAKIWAKIAHDSQELPFKVTKQDVVLVASVDTTATTVGTFIRAMILNPEAQKRAQQEIEAVIGRHRLPTFSDREYLPYVEAVLKETLRWQPAVPPSLPYRSSESVEYEGYFIPKDTTVIANSWHITRDEELYPDSESFIPERFLDPPTFQFTVRDGKPPLDPTTYAFGYGRRKCPGIYFADSMVWFTIVTLLATTRVIPAKDSDGKDILPTAEYTGGMVR